MDLRPTDGQHFAMKTSTSSFRPASSFFFVNHFSSCLIRRVGVIAVDFVHSGVPHFGVVDVVHIFHQCLIYIFTLEFPCFVSPLVRLRGIIVVHMRPGA